VIWHVPELPELCVDDEAAKYMEKLYLKYDDNILGVLFSLLISWISLMNRLFF